MIAMDKTISNDPCLCGRCRQFAPDGEFKFHVNPLQMHVFPAVPVKVRYSLS